MVYNLYGKPHMIVAAARRAVEQKAFLLNLGTVTATKGHPKSSKRYAKNVCSVEHPTWSKAN